MSRDDEGIRCQIMDNQYQLLILGTPRVVNNISAKKNEEETSACFSHLYSLFLPNPTPPDSDVIAGQNECPPMVNNIDLTYTREDIEGLQSNELNKVYTNTVIASGT